MPNCGRSKPQYDIFSRYALIHKLVHHISFSDIALKPYFPIHNIEVKYNGEDVLVTLPTHAEQLKMIVFPVGNDHGFYIRLINRL